MNKETYERAKLTITEFETSILTDLVVGSAAMFNPTIGINGTLVLGGTFIPPRLLRGYREE